MIEITNAYDINQKTIVNKGFKLVDDKHLS